MLLNIAYVRQSIIADHSAPWIRCTALLCSAVKSKFGGVSIVSHCKLILFYTLFFSPLVACFSSIQKIKEGLMQELWCSTKRKNWSLCLNTHKCVYFLLSHLIISCVRFSYCWLVWCRFWLLQAAFVSDLFYSRRPGSPAVKERDGDTPSQSGNDGVNRIC